MANTDLDNKIIAWGTKYLLSHGYNLRDTLPENILNTPWSLVVRFITSDGYIYLKHTPKLLSLEATIIKILHEQFNAPVPKIIAHNPDLNCFLMQDAGQPLRGILKSKFDEMLVMKTIDQFASLQLSITDHVDVFIDIGVPDWRLDKLPDLYQQLLSEKAVLIEDGLSENEIKELELLHPKVLSLCNELSSYSIGETIVQPDFNDNNTLINDTLNKITIIDLGEIVISHPFFSLINFLHVLKKHHGLKEDSEEYQKIKNVCFKHYVDLLTEEKLSTVLKITRSLFFIYAALSNYRLLMACDKSAFTGSFQRQGRPSIPLRDFILECYKLCE